jgi:uncharacterized membrane protein HdeD (DUF308 family)
MNIDLDRRPLGVALRYELDALQGNWFWFVLLGVALVFLGMVALSSVMTTSLAAAMAIGVLLLLGGVAECVGAFWCRGWSGFFSNCSQACCRSSSGSCSCEHRSAP